MRFNVEHQFPADVISEQIKQMKKSGIRQLVDLPLEAAMTVSKLMNDDSAFNPLKVIASTLNPHGKYQNQPQPQSLASLLTLPLYPELSFNEYLKIQSLVRMMATPNTFRAFRQHESTAASLDFYNFNIEYVPSRSVNRAIKFGVRFDREHNVGEDSQNQKHSKKADASYDEKKLSIVQDSTPNSEPRRNQYFQNAAQGIQQATVVVVDAYAQFEGQSPASYVLTLAQAQSPVDEKERFLLYANAKQAKSPENRQFSATYNVKYPRTPVAMNFDQATQAVQEKAQGKLYLYSEDKQVATFKIQMEQSPEYLKELRRSDMGEECLEDMKHTKQSPQNHQMETCLDASYYAQLYDQINIQGEIPEGTELTPEMRNVTFQLWGVLRQIGYFNMEENYNRQGKPNRFEIDMDLDHIEGAMNVSLQTPYVYQRFREVPIPEAIRPWVEQMPEMNLAERVERQLDQQNNVCVVDHNSVLTFDNRQVDEIQIGKCWQAIVQSRPVELKNKQQVNRHEEVSILLRQLQNSNNQRELYVVVAQSNGPDHNIQVTPTTNTYTVLVNGKQQQVSQTEAIDVYDANYQPQDEPAVRIYLVSPQEVKLVIRDGALSVYFDGSVVRVHAEGRYRNNVVGVCGTFNNEEIDDVAGPQGALLNKPKYLAYAWTLTGEQCQDVNAKQLVTKAAQHETPAPSSYQSARYVSDFEAGQPGKMYSNSRWQHDSSSSDSSSSSSSSSSSESSSSSSSSSSSEEGSGHKHNQQSRKQNNKKSQNKSCNVRSQTQYVNVGQETCFTLEPINVCSSHCQPQDIQNTVYPAYCKNSEDSVAQMYVQQIQKGVSPDLSAKRANRQNIRFPVPASCSRQ